MSVNFSFSEEQELFRQSVQDFVRREVNEELIRECEGSRRPPLEVFRKLTAMGWLDCGLPTEDGPGDYLTFYILLTELAKGYLPLADLAYRCVVHGGTTIGIHGTEAQKEQLLPGIVNGEVFFVNGITEPDTGADAASVSTSAVLEGAEWVINGTKTFNTGMLFSHYVVCYARTDLSAPKHSGITAIIVPVDSPGLAVTPLNTVGYRTMVTSEVRYDNVRVPEENVLGSVGGGWKIMVGHLDKERFGLSCICTGSTQRVLDIAVEYANQREQFGQPIGTFQALQHMMADLAISVHGGALMTQNLAWRISQGLESRMESALTKAYTARMYKEGADVGLQIFGAYGYIMESEINRHWRDSRVHPIAGGSIQIQRNIIARQLGLGRAR